MATRIIEYGGLVANKPTVVPAERHIITQAAMTAGASPTSSSAFADETTLVLVQSDEAIYVRMGTAPTATTDNYRIPAAGEQFFSVPRGAAWKVSIRT
jgi:uncharacterized protein YcgI (DUF1989 family)